MRREKSVLLRAEARGERRARGLATACVGVLQLLLRGSCGVYYLRCFHISQKEAHLPQHLVPPPRAVCRPPRAFVFCYDLMAYVFAELATTRAANPGFAGSGGRSHKTRGVSF